VLTNSNDPRKYWTVLKASLKKSNYQLTTNCSQFKLTTEGSKRLTGCLVQDDIPFMDGNGRSTRIWLDLILKKQLKLCIDWCLIDKKHYLAAMEKSVVSSGQIKALLQSVLTNKIYDREVFMKGVDYSYYYEQENDISEDEG
jgi:hypothetical protein